MSVSSQQAQRPPGPGLHERAGQARRAAAALLDTAQTLQATLPTAADPGGHDAAADPALIDALLTAHADAQDFYTDHLTGSGVPRYLADRGIPPEIQRRRDLGYAPPGWTTLVSHLRERGHSDEVILVAGLGRRSSRGTLIDLFRDRAIFPVRDEHGSTVAFIGRAAPNATTGPKYLNSPNTPIYHKHSTPYGLAESRAALTAGARPVIVEGVLDAIAVNHAAPLRYAAIALGGVALHPEHLAALCRITDPARTGVLMALDPDTAGQHGQTSAYAMLATLTTSIHVALLPPGHDPAQLLQTSGAHALADALDQQRPLADLVINHHLAYWQGKTAAEDRINALRSTAAVIATLAPAHVARQTARLAERLSLDPGDVTHAVIAAVEQLYDAPKRIARRAHDRSGGRPGIPAEAVQAVSLARVATPATPAQHPRPAATGAPTAPGTAPRPTAVPSHSRQRDDQLSR